MKPRSKAGSPAWATSKSISHSAPSLADQDVLRREVAVHEAEAAVEHLLDDAPIARCSRGQRAHHRPVVRVDAELLERLDVVEAAEDARRRSTLRRGCVGEQQRRAAARPSGSAARPRAAAPSSCATSPAPSRSRTRSAPRRRRARRGPSPARDVRRARSARASVSARSRFASHSSSTRRLGQRLLHDCAEPPASTASTTFETPHFELVASTGAPGSTSPRSASQAADRFGRVFHKSLPQTLARLVTVGDGPGSMPCGSRRCRRRCRGSCSRSRAVCRIEPGTSSETGPWATRRAMKRCQETSPPRSPSSQKLRCRAPRISRGPIVFALGGTHDQSPPKECRAFCMIVIGCSSTRRAPARL